MISNYKSTGLIVAIILATLIGFISCKKNPALYDRLTFHKEVSDTQLLQAAQTFYSSQKKLPLADGSKEQRPVDFLVPDWDKAKYTKNSLGEKVIGVPLTSSAFEHNELNVVIKDGISYGIIKRFTEKNNLTHLVVVSPIGLHLGDLVYSSKGSNNDLQLVTRKMSVQSRQSPLFSSTEETSEGGELEEVTITPTGGGQTPTPIVFPPAPVSNPPSGTTQIGSHTASEEDSSDGGWGNPISSQPLPRQTVPTLAAFTAAFPNVPSGDVYNLIGGEVKAARVDNPTSYRNACALRVSRALNYSGVTIPEMPGVTLKGSDGKNYIVKTGDLTTFCNETFGEPSTKLSFPSKATAEYTLNRISGIYIMRASYPGIYGATGHATYVNNQARSDLDYDAKGGVFEIRVWPFRTQE